MMKSFADAARFSTSTCASLSRPGRAALSLMTTVSSWSPRFADLCAGRWIEGQTSFRPEAAGRHLRHRHVRHQRVVDVGWPRIRVEGQQDPSGCMRPFERRTRAQEVVRQLDRPLPQDWIAGRNLGASSETLLSCRRKRKQNFVRREVVDRCVVPHLEFGPLLAR